MGQKPTSGSPILVEDYNTPIIIKITAVMANDIIIDPIQPTLFEKKKNLLVPARRTVQLLSQFRSAPLDRATRGLAPAAVAQVAKTRGVGNGFLSLGPHLKR